MPKVWVLQHAPHEHLGTIQEALRGHSIGADYIQGYAGEPVPENLGDHAGLIVMGGPMGVYEQSRYPYLRRELRLIESALSLQKPVLGVCLGSQLLAAALGAEVTKGEKKELGWHAVSLSESAGNDALFSGIQPAFAPFHWHGDVFSLPPEAIGLAQSRYAPCQAFRYGQNAYGILFHLEVSRPLIEQWLVDFAEELRQEGGDAAEITAQIPRYLPDTEQIGSKVFGRWAALVDSAKRP